MDTTAWKAELNQVAEVFAGVEAALKVLEAFKDAAAGADPPRELLALRDESLQAVVWCQARIAVLKARLTEDYLRAIEARSATGIPAPPGPPNLAP